MSPFLEARHDAAVGRYAMAVIPGLKGFNQDDIAVAIEYEHDVAVARAGAEGEPSHVVIIKFTGGLDDYVELV